MSLADIIDVETTIKISTIAQAGFDMPLVFAHHNHFADLVREYEFDSFDTAMVADGFATTEAAYQAALSLSKQEPVGSKFKVGKRQSADIQKVRLIPIVVANSTIYSLQVDKPNGQTVLASFTSDASATLAEVCTGLAAAINTATGDTTAVGSGGTYVENTSVADQQWGFHDLSANLFLIDESLSSGTLGADLTAIRDYDDDWYGLVLASSAPNAIEECADWVETNKSKVFIAQTHDMKVFDATTYSSGNIFKSIKDQGYARTHVTYNSRAQVFYGGAWLAQLLTYEPGQADFMFKTVVGAVAEKLSPSNAAKIDAQNGSFYQTVYRGKAITGSAEGGGTGIFLDLTLLSDWANARAIEAVLRMLTSSPKVAHTDEGAGNGIWGCYKSVIDQGIANEAINGDPTTWEIYVPQRKQLTSADRSAYRWPGTYMVFTPTGALHSLGKVRITLNVA